jgi:hypothetical protein
MDQGEYPKPIQTPSGHDSMIVTTDIRGHVMKTVNAGLRAGQGRLFLKLGA